VSRADYTDPHVLRLLLLKITFGITYGRDSDANVSSMQVIIAGASHLFKLRGKLRGHEKTMPVSITVRNGKTQCMALSAT
jgi:hypothetical protein